MTRMDGMDAAEYSRMDDGRTRTNTDEHGRGRMGGARDGVVMVSLWKDDGERRLAERMWHLVGKSHPAPWLRWVWVVGDSSDDTEERLRAVAVGRRITVVRRDTGIVGDEPETRLRRLSETVNAAWEYVGDARWVVLHESDIVSPADVVERLVSHAEAGRAPVAGWPVLGDGPNAVFYDIWGYRAGGTLFSNWPPYHAVYRPDEVFEVDSVGTCWLFHAEDVRGPDGIRCVDRAVLDLCAGMRERGRRFWVDPGLRVVQPVDLWVSRRMAP